MPRENNYRPLKDPHQAIFLTTCVSEIQGWIILVGNQVTPACLSAIYLLIYFGK